MPLTLCMRHNKDILIFLCLEKERSWSKAVCIGKVNLKHFGLRDEDRTSEMGIFKIMDFFEEKLKEISKNWSI